MSLRNRQVVGMGVPGHMDVSEPVPAPESRCKGDWREEKQALRQNLQGQLSLEDSDRGRCQPRRQRTIGDMKTPPGEDWAESGGWDRPAGSVPKEMDLFKEFFSFI